MLRDSINEMYKHKSREKEKLDKDWKAKQLRYGSMNALVERLHKAIIWPLNGIFKTVASKGHILVRLQVKDWFKDSVRNDDIVQSRRK
jgi:hypothetical protein